MAKLKDIDIECGKDLGMTNLTPEYIPLVKPDEKGFTDIFYQVAHGLDISKYSKKELDVFSSNGYHLIHIAVIFNNINALKHLYNMAIDINMPVKNQKLRKPIHFAAKYGHTEAIEFLLKNGANIDERDNYYLRPIDLAAKYGHTKTLEFLIKNGADIHDPDEGVMQPIHYAAEKGHTKIIELLLKNGANIHVSTYYNDEVKQSINIAAIHGHVETVEFLLKNGAHINGIQDDKPTISDAAEYGQIETIKLLLKNGANIYDPNEDNRQPIHYAAKQGYTEIVELLLTMGADVDIKDWGLRTPLHFAALYGHVEVVKLLLQKGADIHAMDVEGEQPINCVTRSKSSQTVDLLIREYKKLKQEDKLKTALTENNFFIFSDILNDINYDFYSNIYTLIFAKLYKQLDNDQKTALEINFNNHPNFAFFKQAIAYSKISSILDIESIISIMVELAKKGKTFMEMGRIFTKAEKLHSKLESTIQAPDKFVDFEDLKFSTKLSLTANNLNIPGLHLDELNKIFSYITENDGINYAKALNITFNDVTTNQDAKPDQTPAVIAVSDAKRQKH